MNCKQRLTLSAVGGCLAGSLIAFIGILALGGGILNAAECAAFGFSLSAFLLGPVAFLIGAALDS